MFAVYVFYGSLVSVVLIDVLFIFAILTFIGILRTWVWVIHLSIKYKSKNQNNNKNTNKIISKYIL